MQPLTCPAWALECAAGRVVACSLEREADVALARVVLKWLQAGRPAAALARANSRPAVFVPYLPAYHNT